MLKVALCLPTTNINTKRKNRVGQSLSYATEVDTTKNVTLSDTYIYLPSSYPSTSSLTLSLAQSILCYLSSKKLTFPMNIHYWVEEYFHSELGSTLALFLIIVLLVWKSTIFPLITKISLLNTWTIFVYVFVSTTGMLPLR